MYIIYISNLHYTLNFSVYNNVPYTPGKLHRIPAAAV